MLIDTQQTLIGNMKRLFQRYVYSTEDDPNEVEIPLNFNFENSNEDLNRPFTEGEINICIKK